MPRKRRFTLTTNLQWRKRLKVTAAVRSYLLTLGKDKPIGSDHDFYLGAAKSQHDWRSHNRAKEQWQEIESAINAHKKVIHRVGGSILVEYDPLKPPRDDMKPIIIEGRTARPVGILAEAKTISTETESPDTFLDEIKLPPHDVRTSIQSAIAQYLDIKQSAQSYQ